MSHDATAFVLREHRCNELISKHYQQLDWPTSTPSRNTNRYLPLYKAIAEICTVDLTRILSDISIITNDIQYKNHQVRVIHMLCIFDHILGKALLEKIFRYYIMITTMTNEF